mmetsp:Transcript_3531/g.13506  ORF Transcript_3531/g.13506 Transcript_3531/m.13506 type:complete len:203 (-) Transcript_3531:640-1248(-)|eukprot:CAMPEP_0117446842 /NCGR_PEP_ID=MMETSP0759-20121206/6558_1 /TAXON_ID=63605 /ORGANISM="Percolomonas cosmopolitus, Strain WS" /LENGTH=202 /DNA_ID=CAMNT_0005239139 /DNA_START=65 /DNA_END=673 /DNA_ORIENTATION=-
MPKLRSLKPHERRIVKKVDFYNWKTEEKVTAKIAIINHIRNFGLSGHDEYYRYNDIRKKINECLLDLYGKRMNAASSDGELKGFLDSQIDVLCDKLYAMGVLDGKNEFKESFTKHGIPIDRFLRRRLTFVMSNELGMGETVKKANRFIKDGHVKVGPKVITDPAFLVTRTLEDYVTWSQKSNIRKTVLKYNNMWDDYDVEAC